MPQLNSGATFWVSHQDHAIRDSWYSDGLYSHDTRFLSKWQITVNDKEPFCLTYSEFDHAHGQWVLIAPALITSADGIPTEVSITLDRFMTQGELHEDLTLNTYGTVPVILTLSLTLATDFADLFEVRRQQWQSRSTSTEWHPDDHILFSSYANKDFYRERRTYITSDTTPTVNGSTVSFSITLSPGEQWHACLAHCLITDRAAAKTPMECPLPAWHEATPVTGTHTPHRPGLPQDVPTYRVAHHAFQTAIDQSTRDLHALRIPNPAGASLPDIPAAGIPWFVALFGRDSVIASLQTLVHNPEFARGTIAALAAFQATKLDAYRDAEPGKICHELRVGEWAVFGLIPHNPYYGSADATALYLYLIGMVYQWTGDAEWLRQFKDSIDKALEWVDRYGDVDGDGFQEYGPRAMTGYPNQCWRDSPDGVPDEEGHTPSHPIGTSELQAYVFAAKHALAPLYAIWGEEQRSGTLQREATELKHRFREVFWLPDKGTVALCIDGRKHAIGTPSSDTGHCLWMGILDEDVAEASARQLLSPELFSGWGIRTLATSHPAYDPHSYHRGSVWPHDSMIAAAGLMRYGFVEEAWSVIRGVIDATGYFANAQIPEVFSGLDRSAIPVPVPYRRPNIPQAWAAGSIIYAVDILLGIDPDIPNGIIRFHPHLPSWCPTISIEELRVGSRNLSVHAYRKEDGSSHLEARVTHGDPIEIICTTEPRHNTTTLPHA